jgi:hypothetical protein
MRQFSDNVKLLLSDTYRINAFSLVEMKNKNVTIRHTTLPYNCNITGIGNFLADNGLRGLEPPKLSATVDRETYKIVYADPEFLFKEIFEQGFVGADITIWAGLLNTTTGVVGGAGPGEPLLSSSDLIMLYKGVVDTHAYSIKDHEEVICTIEGSSPMANLALVKNRMTSQDCLRQLGISDSAFDSVYAGSAAVNLLWGKK